MSTVDNLEGPAAQLAYSPPSELLHSQSIKPRLPWLSTTRILFTCNMIVFYAMLAYWIHITDTPKVLNSYVASDFDLDLMRRWGSNYGPLTLSGQFWRLITAAFLHWNVAHLMGNMLFLWRFGTYLDRLFTRTQMLAIYLLTGAAASVVSLGWHPLVNSAGSSGAIYGFAGVLVAFLLLARSNFSRRNIISILIWLILVTPFELLWSHVSKQVNYASHAGGVASGLIIGALLAWTFRLPAAERAARQNRILRSAIIPLVIIFAVVTQVRSGVVREFNDHIAETSEEVNYGSQIPIARVYLDIKGDPKLARRLASYLDLELDDFGIALAKTQDEADAVIQGQVGVHLRRKSFSYDVIQTQVTFKGTVDQMNSCFGVSTSGNAVFFHTATTEASEIREKYPAAQTVRIDPASNMDASEEFGTELRDELK